MNTEQSRKIEALYLEMFENMMAYACSCLHSELLAEEAVQEAFRIACQKPGQLCESANPRGWLVLTLKFTIRSIQNSQNSARKLLEAYLLRQIKDASGEENSLDPGVLYENVAETEEFKLLSELAIEGRPYLEMAKSRGITVDACKKRVQRAKKILQKNLEEDVTE